MIFPKGWALKVATDRRGMSGDAKAALQVLFEDGERTGHKRTARSALAHLKRAGLPVSEWPKEKQIKSFFSSLSRKKEFRSEQPEGDTALCPDEVTELAAEVADEIREMPPATSSICPECGKPGLRRLSYHLKRWCRALH